METIIILLGISFVSAANAFIQELANIGSIIEEKVETPVIWPDSHGFCAEKSGLLSAYIPRKNFIIICQSNHNKNYNELVGTLKYEGWHAVQHKCNDFRAALSDERIRPHLKDRDRKNLHSYHPKQTRAEAEAYVVEQIPTQAWIRGVRIYCE